MTSIIPRKTMRDVVSSLVGSSFRRVQQDGRVTFARQDHDPGTASEPVPGRVPRRVPDALRTGGSPGDIRAGFIDQGFEHVRSTCRGPRPIRSTAPRSPTSSSACSTKGLVIAGDIKIKLVDIELLTIQIRLVVASVDKAREMGMDWWTNNADFRPALAPPAEQAELIELRERLARLESMAIASA